MCEKVLARRRSSFTHVSTRVSLCRAILTVVEEKMVGFDVCSALIASTKGVVLAGVSTCILLCHCISLMGMQPLSQTRS